MIFIINKKIKRLLMPPALSALLLFTLLGCLQQKAAKVEGSASLFAGAKAAINKGQAIEVKWDTPPIAVSKFNIYRVDAEGKTALIGTASSSSLSFLDSNLEVGKSYSYIVRLVDSADVEDTNTSIVSSVTFTGLYDLQVTGSTTATAYLTGIGGAFDEIRIYGQPVRGGTRQLLKTVPPNTTEIAITGLRSGTTYNFNAQAYISSLGTEDGNAFNIKRQTQSDSFYGTGYKYRGFMLVKGFGDAPGAKWSAQPGTMSEYDHIKTAREISLTWLPFQDASAQTRYKVVRTDSSRLPDMTTTAACTATTLTSCVVCAAQGSGPRTCVDLALPAPPQKLRYAVSLEKLYGAEAWVEELPTDEVDWKAVSIEAAVPPANMVLTQRDSANWEFCQMLGKGTDPKKWQRCVYTGLGATPTNSGPGNGLLALETGYFDFGYNLFVDRWESACNWTKQTMGGMCGPGGTPGDCWGPANYTTTVSLAAPDVNIGAQGDVYYQVANYVSSGSTGTGSSGGQWHGCYIKSGGAWLRGDSASIPTDLRAKMYTSDPSAGHRIPAGVTSARSSWNFCQAQNSEYGDKRLPRRRETVAFAAPSVAYGEPGARSLEEWSRIENGDYGHQSGTWGCNTRTHGASTFGVGVLGRIDVVPNFTDLKTPGYELPRYGNNASANTESSALDIRGMGIFYSGSLATSDCVSRYGVQDFSGNSSEWISDQLEVCTNNSPTSCRGVTSSLDSGNDDINGLPFDGSAAATLTNSYSYRTDTQTNWDTTGNSWNIFTDNNGATAPGGSGLQTYYTGVDTYQYLIPTLGIPLVGSYGSPAGNYFTRNDFIANQVFAKSPNISISLHTTNRTNFIIRSRNTSGSSSGRWDFAIIHDGTYTTPWLSTFRCVIPAR